MNKTSTKNHKKSLAREIRLGIKSTATIISVALVTPLISCTHTHQSPIEDGLSFAQRGQYENAVEVVEKYKQKRLQNENREEWDNPYFYNLFLADFYLALEKPEKALNLINEANNQNIDTRLILDRATRVMTYYEERGNLDDAVQIMYRYHTLNPILCEIHLDRLLRKLTEQERN